MQTELKVGPEEIHPLTDLSELKLRASRQTTGIVARSDIAEDGVVLGDAALRGLEQDGVTRCLHHSQPHSAVCSRRLDLVNAVVVDVAGKQLHVKGEDSEKWRLGWQFSYVADC